MSKAFHDRWQDRFQFEIGVSWTLVPRRGNTWRQWLFDPEWGLTVVGQKFLPMTNGRTQLPDGFEIKTMVDTVDDGKGIDPATNLKNWWFISRVFWLRGSIRILGLDVGAGIYWRKRYSPTSNGGQP